MGGRWGWDGLDTCRKAGCTMWGESDTEELTLAQRRDTGVNDGCLSYWREGHKQPAEGVEACEHVEPTPERQRCVSLCVCLTEERARARVCVRACVSVYVNVTDAPGRGYHHGNWIEAVSAQ